MQHGADFADVFAVVAVFDGLNDERELNPRRSI